MMLQDVNGGPVPNAHAADAFDAFVSLHSHEHGVDRPAANSYKISSEQLAIVWEDVQRGDEKVSASLSGFADGTPRRNYLNISDDHGPLLGNSLYSFTSGAYTTADCVE